MFSHCPNVQIDFEVPPPSNNEAYPIEAPRYPPINQDNRDKLYGNGLLIYLKDFRYGQFRK